MRPAPVLCRAAVARDFCVHCVACGLVQGQITNVVSSHSCEEILADYTVRSAKSPDFLIALQGIKKTETSGSTAVGASIGVPVGGRGSMSVGVGKSKPRVKQEGTLILDFLDRKDSTKIWQGTATAGIQPKSSPEEQQRINMVVAELLKNFPPRGK